MFGFKIVHHRELSLYTATILDLRQEKLALQATVESERRRADAAVNALLIRTNKIALSPNPIPLNEDQEEAMKQSALDIFGDSQELKEQETMEKLQHDRS
jgi:hypothetical protein